MIKTAILRTIIGKKLRLGKINSFLTKISPKENSFQQIKFKSEKQYQQNHPKTIHQRIEKVEEKKDKGQVEGKEVEMSKHSEAEEEKMDGDGVIEEGALKDEVIEEGELKEEVIEEGELKDGDEEAEKKEESRFMYDNFSNCYYDPVTKFIWDTEGKKKN